MVRTKGEQTRDAILAVAVERFGRDGYRTTSVADIARSAGVSGSLVYAYFPNKEALFLAAIDLDAASVVDRGLRSVTAGGRIADWREQLVLTLLDALDGHPLARRLLAGLEPEVTRRVLDIGALVELRKAVAERLFAEQLAGTVRSSIDTVAIANGIVAIVLSLLMSIVQLGADTVLGYAPDVAAVFAAAIEPEGPRPAG